ncbi:histone-lysine N-methyltransferase [Salmonella enterica subsp. enterica]|nr:histone-lysine N-methyltransferase [Salmonella enterica subsp. enterica]
MYELTLSPSEIQEITGYKRYTQQQNQLRCHGIPFTTGQKNEPIVLRRNFQQQIKPLPKLSEYISSEPDFGALDNGQTT